MTIKSSTNNDPSRISHTRIVVRSAIVSRLGVLTLMVIWRSMLSPYDTSASINPSCLSSTTTDHEEELVLFPRIAAAIENGIVWDSVYFVRIAQCGYEYEQTFAFLPLLPLCISLLSRTGQSLQLSFLQSQHFTSSESIRTQEIMCKKTFYLVLQ